MCKLASQSVIITIAAINRSKRKRITCSFITRPIGQIILSREKWVAQVVMWRHDSLWGWGPWSITFSFPFTTSFSLVRCLFTHCGWFALVLASVLMQNIQGFRLRGWLASHWWTGTGFVTIFTMGDLRTVRWKRVSWWQVGPYKRTLISKWQ